MGNRPGTSMGNRPGTSAGQRPDTAGSDIQESPGEDFSDLTYGSGGVFCGNPVRALRNRRKKQVSVGKKLLIIIIDRHLSTLYGSDM